MKKLFVIFLYSMTVFSAHAQQDKIILNEDFSGNKFKWYEASDTAINWKLENGRYYRENLKDLSYTTLIPVDLSPSKNFSVSLKTTHLSGQNDKAYGIAFGALDNENVFGFLVASTGHFMVYKRENSILKNISEWKETNAVKKDNNLDNLLSIKKETGTWKFYINDQLVYNIPAKKLFGYKFGITSEGKQAVAFDDLVITEGSDASTPTGSVRTTAIETGLMKEDFSNNLRNWPEYSDEYGIAAVKNGKYTIENKKNATFSIFDITINEEKGYSISLKATHLSGDNNKFFALLFGYDDTKNYFAFGITANGTFLVWKRKDNNLKQLINVTPSNAIKKEDKATNILTIKKEDDSWRFFINDQFVGSCPSQDFFYGSTGVMVEGNQTLEFDDLNVNQIDVTKFYKTKLCLIEKGILKEVEGELTEDDQVTTLINGKTQTFNKNSPPDLLGYAAKQPWFINNELITFKGLNFSKYGLLRTLGSNEIRKAGEYKSVGIYMEAGKTAIDSSTIIYVPVRLGCEWQPYAIQCPDFELNAPMYVPIGDTITLIANLTHINNAKYNWIITQGKIIKGQGTKSIQVSTAGVLLRSTIDVNVAYSPKQSGCENSKSASMRVMNKPAKPGEGGRTPRQRSTGN